MQYAKYFKLKQKFFVRDITLSERLEGFSAYLVKTEPDSFSLGLPYPVRNGEGPPLPQGRSLQLCTESFGLGVRLTAEVLDQDGKNLIRVRPNQDMEIFQHRKYLRADIRAGVCCFRGDWSLQSFRTQWEKVRRNPQILTTGPKAPGFTPTDINLSAGGIRMDLKAPVRMGEICLLCLSLGDDQSAIPSLAEVVRIDEPAAENRQSAAMKFIQILESDQVRIDAFNREEYRRKGLEVDIRPFKGREGA